MYTQEQFYENLIEKISNIFSKKKHSVIMPREIIAVDKFSVLILSNGKQQFLYKQAISTVSS